MLHKGGGSGPSGGITNVKQRDPTSKGPRSSHPPGRTSLNTHRRGLALSRISNRNGPTDPSGQSRDSRTRTPASTPKGNKQRTARPERISASQVTQQSTANIQGMPPLLSRGGRIRKENWEDQRLIEMERGSNLRDMVQSRPQKDAIRQNRQERGVNQQGTQVTKPAGRSYGDQKQDLGRQSLERSRNQRLKGGALKTLKHNQKIPRRNQGTPRRARQSKTPQQPRSQGLNRGNRRPKLTKQSDGCQLRTQGGDRQTQRKPIPQEFQNLHSGTITGSESMPRTPSREHLPGTTISPEGSRTVRILDVHRHLTRQAQRHQPDPLNLQAARRSWRSTPGIGAGTRGGGTRGRNQGSSTANSRRTGNQGRLTQ